MIKKTDFAKLDIFKRKGVSINKLKNDTVNNNDNIKLRKLKNKNTLVKWSIYVNPLLKRAIRVYAASNDKKEYIVVCEALAEYMNNHKINKI
ncbi:MAG: hypothetical protein LBH27_02715 [Endomicrobium sp.]|jgi:hypothetical protein|nr:hypothetical protein [Endomicrobium sp.]